jgi:hypothetical protein
VDSSNVRKITFAFGGLLSQNMTFESVFPLDFTRSGKGKPLFGTGISLDF